MLVNGALHVMDVDGEVTAHLVFDYASGTTIAGVLELREHVREGMEVHAKRAGLDPGRRNPRLSSISFFPATETVWSAEYVDY